ncbi:MAG: prepilin-type N-terminal cleavage/methylation domain-containing protein [Puniceicoccales bacterium]|nr:prepilin-type N-terminal cleavage/methylation domain-containing protein [Puniceicoccales bacterium]
MTKQIQKHFEALRRAPAFVRHAPASKAGFTLIELLVVITIIAFIAAVVVSINADPPQSLSSAQNAAKTIFRAARLRSQSPNPDRNPKENPLYNIRSRVIILNDPSLPEEHLRLMRVIIGGTRSAEKTKPSDYYWYDTDTQYVLPKGIYMVDVAARVAGGREGFPQERRSQISNKDSTDTEMRKNYQPSVKAQKEGEGDRSWYFYEFDSNGTSNMNVATFIIAKGNFTPNSDGVLFQNIHNIAGLYVTPSGETILYNDGFEMDKTSLQ